MRCVHCNHIHCRDNIQARIRSIQVKRLVVDTIDAIKYCNRIREKKASNAAQKISDYRAKEKSRMDVRTKIIVFCHSHSAL